MFTKNQIEQMFKLQDKFNTELSPTWKTDVNDWGLAIAMEAAEAIDHLGWKWWKAQESDLEQAKIELVDIWHFLISYKISHKNDCDLDELLDVMTVNLSVLEFMSHTSMLKKIVGFGMNGYFVNYHFSYFAATLNFFGMTGDDVYRMYISKNALNHLRQRHGYKDGVYVKDWSKAGYSEDNQALEQFFKNSDLDSPSLFDDATEYLERVYQDVIK